MGNAAEHLQLEQVAVADLVPSAHNPRVMPPAEMAALERSIAEFGLVDPVIARRQDRMVIGGHQRVEAAKKLGLATVPVVLLDLTEAQAKALNIALNKIHGDWDLEQLGDILCELRDLPDIDVTLTGFDSEELEDLLAELEAGQTSPASEGDLELADDLARLQANMGPSRVQPGQVWQLGSHRLLCGDALTENALPRLCDGQKAPLVVTEIMSRP